MFIRRLAPCLLAIALVLVKPGPARACGGGGVVSVQAATVGSNAQRVFMSLRGNVTEIVTQIGVTGGRDDFGVLVPAAALPVLDPQPVPVEELAALAQATAPTLIRSTTFGEDGGCNCLPIAGSKAGGASPNTVELAPPVNIGPVTAVVLDAAAPDPLLAWLADHHFIIPEAQKPLVTAYAQPGRYFVAIRRAAGAVTTEATSVGVHMTIPGDQRGLPLRFSSIGAQEQVAFTVFVLSPQEAAPRGVGPSSPFEGLTLDGLLEDDLQDVGYAGALLRAAGRLKGRAFVIEGVHAAVSLRERKALGPRLGALFDGPTTLTRLSTVVAATDLNADVAFQKPLEKDVPTMRVLGPVGSGTGAGRGMALVIALALAAALVRAVRRRFAFGAAAPRMPACPSWSRSLR